MSDLFLATRCKQVLVALFPDRQGGGRYYADSPLLASHLMTPSEVSMVRLGANGYLGAPV